MLLSEIKQGESLALKYGLAPAEDMSNWSCRVMVKASKSGSALIDKTLADLSGDNFYFVGQLLPTETSGLPVGNLWLLAELSNSSTNENAEIHDRLSVSRQAVP